MAGPIRIAILANGKQARNEAALTARAYGGLGRTLGKIGAATGLTVLTAKAVGFAASSVKLEAQYSQTMATIQSATGASESAMGKLNKMALKLGADTSFSAKDAADAMLELAKAGVSTKNIMGGGVAGTLQLAAAGGTELGTAATIASNAMNAFNLGGQKMGSIAAALAGGANASSASVESLGQGLAQVGAGAVNAGLNLQETVAALAAFDNAGVKGSDAGTSLKTMLSRLVPQTLKARSAMQDLGLDFTKSSGEFVSLTNISEQLKRRLGGLSAEQRTTALATIFGSDATRAASILMRQGAAGIKKYIKATQDQSAAQKMAEARMSGTAGSLERLSGAVETAQLRLGQELAPTVQKVANALADDAGPAMEGAIDAGKTLADALTPLAQALAVVGKGALEAGKFVSGLPGPVKEIGIQAGLAALVLPRLSVGVTSVTASVTTNIARLQQWRAELTYTATRAQATSAVMTRLAGAAKAAAGVGGMVALTQATQESNSSLRFLETTLGGAATGFALGGPIGALIGGAGGGLVGLAAATSESATQMVDASGAAKAFAASLDQTTAATTRATRNTALKQITGRLGDSLPIVTGALKQLGLNMRDMIGFSLGEEAATRRLNGAIRENKNSRNDSIRGAAAQIDLQRQFLRGDLQDFQQGRQHTKQRIEDLSTWKQALHGIPKGVRVALRQEGYRPSLAQIKALGRQYDLTPRQIRTIIRLTGAQQVQAQAKGTKKSLAEAGKVKPDTTPWLRGLEAALTTGRQKAGRGAEGIGKSLGQGTGKAKANLSGFNTSLNQGITTAKGSAASGGKQTGNALGQGVYFGVDAWAGPIASRAAAIVAAAVAAAKAAGKVHSPSKVMRDEVGAMLGKGLVLGLGDYERKSRTAGAFLVKTLLAGAVNGTQGLDKAVGEIQDRIGKIYDQRADATEKRLTKRYDAIEKHLRATLKGAALSRALGANSRAEDRAQRAAEKRGNKAERATLTVIRKQLPALRANAKVQDALANGNYLQFLKKGSKLYEQMTAAGVHNLSEARQKVADLKQQSIDYAATVKDAIVSSGSLSTLGQGTGFGSIEQLLTQRAAAVDRAKEFAGIIEQLRGKLNDADLQDIIAQGVEGGFGTAQAILNGGPAVISQMNTLASQLNSTGVTLGSNVASTLYDAGIQSAQGLVDGLIAKAGDLDKQATKLAKALVKAVKKALGIKSPSRVFRGIGDNVAVGLVQGIDARQTYVKRTAADMAASLQKGFGTPALDAWTAGAGAAGQQRMVVDLRLSADQVSQLQRGKQYQEDIDAYSTSGGTRSAP